jgi:DNA-binding MarR family transcriptional regulator
LTIYEQVADSEILDLARHMQSMRAKIIPLFPREVLRDSVLDILLELFVAQLMTRSVCIKELIIVSGETSTSALRRIDRLEESGMVRRCHDPVDHRRVAVALTQRGDEAMRAMLHHLFLDKESTNSRVKAVNSQELPSSGLQPKPN